MLIDLTRQKIHALVDECPGAIVVRTLGLADKGSQGTISRAPDNDNTFPGTYKALLLVSYPVTPGASLQRGDVICYETLLPVALPVPTNTWIKAYTPKATTHAFQTSTLHDIGGKKHSLQLVEIRVAVTTSNPKCVVGVYTGPNMEEVVAFTVNNGTSVDWTFPLNRVDPNTPQLKETGKTTVWDDLEAD